MDSHLHPNHTVNIKEYWDISVLFKNHHKETLDWFGAAKDKNSRLQRLTECQDKESIFELYAEICSWLNHHPLGEIVHECGTESDKQEYEKYIAKKEQFLRCSITFFTDSCSQDLGGAVTEVKLFRLKLDMKLSHDVLDGTILPFLQGELAKLLNIPQMNLYILSLREGCFEVVFSIPEATYEKYFPLTLDRSRALENLTYEPAGLKFKSMYYSDVDVHAWSAESDQQDTSFADTKEQSISYPTDIKVLSIPVDHTEKGKTKSNNIITDDIQCTPDVHVYDVARKHQLGLKYHKDEDNPFDITGTYLLDRMSEQKEADIELGHIVKSGCIKGKRPQIQASMTHSFSELVESNDFGCPNLKRQKKD